MVNASPMQHSSKVLTQRGLSESPPTAQMATSQADSSKFASAAITVIPVVSVSIAPTAVTLSPGGTQAFTATVQNSINTAVNWSIQEGGAGGSVVSGAYIAPNVAGVFHVVATSQADNVAFAVATVTVQAGSASGTIQ